MVYKIYIFILALLGLNLTVFSQKKEQAIKVNVPLDSIRLSDPAILADEATSTYYMTGSGGLMWKSKDLDKWTGPFNVTQTDPESWMGAVSYTHLRAHETDSYL